MFNLLSGELYKLLRSTFTYVIGGIFVAMGLIQISAAFYCSHKDGMMLATYGDEKVFGSDVILSSLSGESFYILIAVMVSMAIGMDYSSNCIRQMSSKGYSRISIVLSKFIAISMIQIAFIFIYMLVMFTGFSIMFGIGTIDGTKLLYILALIIGAISLVVGYSAIVSLISYLLKGSGLSIAINILFIILGGATISLIALITKKYSIAKYWLTTMSSTFGDTEISLATQYKYIIIFFVIAIVMNVLSSLFLKKADIA